MITRTRTTLLRHWFFCLCCSALMLAQQTPAASRAAVPEFPVVLQQGVTAGKTPIGTKIQAKLAVATLVAGTVFPRNAVFSGEVVESAAKTATEPSRLAICMDSVSWKNGSASVKVYLTAWYYPSSAETGQQNLAYGPEQPANRTWNGQGQYPDPNSKVYKPFPGSESDKDKTVPDTPSSTMSTQRVLMKNVMSMHADDGTLAITSSHSNIKLDKLTTYVFAASDWTPAK